MGDGCNQEGVASEAASLAGHLKLGKLIALYDDNNITIDGRTDVSFTEDVLKRYEAYGWHAQHVAEGNTDVNAIAKAIEAAKAVTDKPSIIKVTTTIGYPPTRAIPPVCTVFSGDDENGADAPAAGLGVRPLRSAPGGLRPVPPGH